MNQIVLELVSPPKAVNTRQTGAGWGAAQGRRKAARGAIRSAYMEAAAAAGLTLLDMPRQQKGEMWELEVLWRCGAPLPDEDNATQALKPYLDACVQNVRRGRGAARAVIEGEAPILIDDGPRYLRRSPPVIEEGPPCLILTFSRLAEAAPEEVTAGAPKKRKRKPAPAGNYRITVKGERKPIHERGYTDDPAGRLCLARAIREELSADGLREAAELEGLAERLGLPRDHGSPHYLEILRDHVRDWASAELEAEDRAELMDEVRCHLADRADPQLAPSAASPDGDVEAAHLCARAGLRPHLSGESPAYVDALRTWLAERDAEDREADERLMAEVHDYLGDVAAHDDNGDPPSDRPRDLLERTDIGVRATEGQARAALRSWLLDQRRTTREAPKESAPPPVVPMPEQLADELAAVDAELARLAPAVQRLRDLERRRRRLEHEVARAFMSARRAS